ncbi:hypothetical protein JCM8097_007847 [Rhodosporidiobolus ruineniae]
MPSDTLSLSVTPSPTSPSSLERIPLTAASNVVLPQWTPFLHNARTTRSPEWFEEFERVYWTYDGWDTVADQVLTELALAKSWADKVMDGPHASVQDSIEEERRYKVEAERLKAALQGPAGLCFLRRRYCDLNNLDRSARLTSLPSVEARLSPPRKIYAFFRSKLLA